MPATTTSDLLTILAALEKEMELYASTGMRVSAGRLVLWIHEVRLRRRRRRSVSHDGIL